MEPNISSQSISSTVLPRAHNAVLYLTPLTQNLDLASSEGQQWRVWRSRFSSGFSSKNITAMLPSILEEVAIFRDILLAKAGENNTWGPVFPLEALTTNLTFDVIGRATLGIRLHEQTREPGPLRRALLDQLTHCLFDYNILTLGRILSPIRHWKMARNTRIMRKFLLPHVVSRLESPRSALNDRATIVDFAVEEYNEEATPQEENKPKLSDEEFIETVIAQLKLFLFAGHDTTATSICWVLHCLAKDPAAADLVRAEHDAVLGAGTHETMERLQASPHLLNQLPYTLACIKEALRLWPSVGPIRDGSSSFSFAVPGASVPFPTEGFMIWDGIRAAMRWEHLWVRPLEFIPERWLASPGDPLYPKKNAWHPFGLGFRNCIGQELALVEIKAVLTLVMRDLDIDCGWEEWDALRCAGSQNQRSKRKKLIRFDSINKGPKYAVDGHRCYQVGLGTPHTKAGMPVHVKRRSSPIRHVGSQASN